MAAHGSGALALSMELKTPVMNIDIGGGTTKIAVCEAGEVVASTSVEAGHNTFNEIETTPLPA